MLKRKISKCEHRIIRNTNIIHCVVLLIKYLLNSWTTRSIAELEIAFNCDAGETTGKNCRR